MLIRRFPVMTVVSAVIVLVFGGLTIFLHDDTFIKIKTDADLSSVRGACSRAGLC